MKREIVTILLIITAVLSAGCAGSHEPAAATVQQTITTGIPGTAGTATGVTQIAENHTRGTLKNTATMTTKPQEVTTTRVKIFNGEYHWVEYRTNITVSHNPGSRSQTEYIAKNERSSELYNGIPAIHEKTTVTGSKFHDTDNLYFEKSTKRFLGGTRAVSKSGVDEPLEILPGDEKYCENCYRNWLMITPFEEVNTSLSAEGVESITVPSGTYPDAQKYSGNFSSGIPITFWVVPGVPVPVQYRIPDPGIEGTDPIAMYELRGWG